MIETEVKVEIESDYPKLMISTNSPYIVFFISNSVGFVVRGNDDYDIGEYFDCWDMREFKPFNGEITLKNK